DRRGEDRLPRVFLDARGEGVVDRRDLRLERGELERGDPDRLLRAVVIDGIDRLARSLALRARLNVTDVGAGSRRDDIGRRDVADLQIEALGKEVEREDR